MQGTFRFSFGPWNIHEGADPFGPPVRPSVSFAEKLKVYKKLGFDGVQFHDDDAVAGFFPGKDHHITSAALLGDLQVIRRQGLMLALPTRILPQATHHRKAAPKGG